MAKRDANSRSVETVSAVVVGAGLSGIGMACHLQRALPETDFLVLEARESMGGTWDQFRYPGIRSDSDMFTLGYNFRPWLGAKDIADGPSILSYIQQTARAYNVDSRIRYGYRVTKAQWSSPEALWTLSIQTKAGQRVIKTRMLLMCPGYYDYEKPHDPDFRCRDSFEGKIIHPQFWPADYDYSDKKIVIIGSGATAVTLAPSLAKTARNVTVLQRSPTYIASLAAQSPITRFVRWLLPTMTAYRLLRFIYIQRSTYYYRLCRKFPRFMAFLLLADVKHQVGKSYDVDVHFKPSYNLWDQRLCLVPDGDLFKAIKGERVKMITDQIERFTPSGIRLASGNEIDADVIVTATGLNLKPLGGMEVEVDGVSTKMNEAFTYRGIMGANVPNMVSLFGYINASWTLRADLIAAFACRVMQHMKETNTLQCTPRLRPHDEGMTSRPYMEELTSGYITRSLHLLPRQGSHEPWTNTQDFKKEKDILLKRPLEDGVLIFSHPEPKAEDVSG